jgi:hypothetical protein
MEIWKDIQNYEGSYQVSNLGRIKSLERGDICPNGGKFIRKERIMKLRESNGYRRIQLLRNGKYKVYQVHRVVAIAFISNPDNKPFINHINFIRDDNSVENLEWCTHQENILHNVRNNRVKYNIAEFHPNSSITREQATEVKKLIIKGVKPTPISKQTGINVGIIYNIKAGLSWNHLKI